MPQRQLNIRSDEAFGRATTLAKRFGKTTTEIVVDALRSYEATAEPRDARGFTAEQRRRYEAIVRLAQEAAKHKLPGATSDHSWLYGEDGLPK